MTDFFVYCQYKYCERVSKVYVRRENLHENIKYPQGSAIAVLGEDKELFDELEKNYRLKGETEEGVRFAIVGEDKDMGLNAYKLTLQKIPFCVLGSRPENIFLNDILWNGAVPFVSSIAEPEFMVITQRNQKSDIEFWARLVFAVAEKITVDILSKGYSETVFPLWLSSVESWEDHEREVFGLAKSVAGRIDGLKQTESALSLLRIKEKNEFRRGDTIVLLAKYLAKVYNYFVKYQPTSLFVPDNNMREDALTEFFGVKNPKVRNFASEFEIRKLYYMLTCNAEILLSLWSNVSEIVDGLFSKHRMFTENNGFCLEEVSEDAKFAMFMSPDLLDGQTLLSFIKDCGVADSFI